MSHRHLALVATIHLLLVASACQSPPEKAQGSSDAVRTSKNAQLSRDLDSIDGRAPDDGSNVNGDGSERGGQGSSKRPVVTSDLAHAPDPCPMKSEGDIPEPLTRAAEVFPYPPVYSFQALIGRSGGREFANIIEYGDGSVNVDVFWQPKASDYCLPLELQKGSFRVAHSHARRDFRETTNVQTPDGGTGTTWTSGPPRSPEPSQRHRWKVVNVLGHTAYMQEWDPSQEGQEAWQLQGGDEPYREIYWSVDAPDNQYVHWRVETNPRIHSVDFVLRALNELKPVYPD